MVEFERLLIGGRASTLDSLIQCYGRFSANG